MNRQKEYTEEGRYTPISKAEGGSSKEYYKVVYVIGGDTYTEVTLKTDDIEGRGTVYTNDDPIYDTDTIAITYDHKGDFPSIMTDAGIVTQVSAGTFLYVDEFDCGEGILPLYLQVSVNE